MKPLSLFSAPVVPHSLWLVPVGIGVAALMAAFTLAIHIVNKQTKDD